MLNFGPFFPVSAQRMTARLIDGKAHAAALRGELKATASALIAGGVRPGLAVVVVGDNPASRAYVRSKVKACEEVGVVSELHEFATQTPESALIDRLHALNANPDIDGVLVQLPLPPHIDAARVLAAVAPDTPLWSSAAKSASRFASDAFSSCGSRSSTAGLRSRRFGRLSSTTPPPMVTTGENIRAIK